VLTRLVPDEVSISQVREETAGTLATGAALKHMSSKACSILNDVLGPVMRGPSSSHTAGAHRIATLSRALLGEHPVAVRCVFDPNGSYAPTYKPLGVDLAFAAGLLGWEMTDDRYSTGLDAAQKAGTKLSFDIAPLSCGDMARSCGLPKGESGVS